MGDTRQMSGPAEDGAPGQSAPGGADTGPSDPGRGGDRHGKGRLPASTRLVELATAAGAELFHTPDQVAYARLPRGGHAEVHAVQGAPFRRLLAHLYFADQGRAAGGEAVAAALATLDAIAAFAGPERPVYRRVAPGPDGGLVLDLCDERWRAVVVRPGGWQVVDRSPVLFTRGSAMRPLPEPTRGGDLTALRPLLNLAADDDWLLVAAWLAAAVRPAGPYPVLSLRGEQGTAKTTCARALRRLFDPSAVDLRSAPRDERDLAVSSRHGWALGYDNLSAVPGWLSDALCRVATGGGFATRALFTDDGEAAFDFTRPVLVTAIEGVIVRPDLLDRALAIELAPIPDHRRRTEAALWAGFDAARPGILGGLLDVVAAALVLLPEIAAENRPVPRMADFAVLGEAVARVLGERPGRFLEILRANRAAADGDALDGCVAARALVPWIRSRGAFAGTYTQLLAGLTAAAGDTRKEAGWPVTAAALGRQMHALAPALRRLGVHVAHARVGHDRARTVTVTWDPVTARGLPSAPSAPSAVNTGPPDSRASGADGGEAATVSADRPQYPPPADAAGGADGERVGADGSHGVLPSAPNSRPRQEVAVGADGADGFPQVVAGDRPPVGPYSTGPTPPPSDR